MIGPNLCCLVHELCGGFSRTPELFQLAPGHLDQLLQFGQLSRFFERVGTGDEQDRRCLIG